MRLSVSRLHVGMTELALVVSSLCSNYDMVFFRMLYEHLVRCIKLATDFATGKNMALG